MSHRIDPNTGTTILPAGVVSAGAVTYPNGFPQAAPSVCPGCGRCKDCGQPYAAPPAPLPSYPVYPGWPGYVGPIWQVGVGEDPFATTTWGSGQVNVVSFVGTVLS